VHQQGQKCQLPQNQKLASRQEHNQPLSLSVCDKKAASLCESAQPTNIVVVDIQTWVRSVQHASHSLHGTCRWSSNTQFAIPMNGSLYITLYCITDGPYDVKDLRSQTISMSRLLSNTYPDAAVHSISTCTAHCLNKFRNSTVSQNVTSTTSGCAQQGPLHTKSTQLHSISAPHTSRIWFESLTCT